MIQYMQDSTGLSFDCIMNFIMEKDKESYHCKSCSGFLVKIKGVDPVSVDYYICTGCDSTYNIKEIEGK